MAKDYESDHFAPENWIIGGVMTAAIVMIAICAEFINLL